MDNIQELESALKTLYSAIEKNRSKKYCLGCWSRFIRIRDCNRCVACHETSDLAAHHVVRKIFLKQASLYTGNGITLCPTCHKEPHAGFNRRPNFQMPMDAEGGEKLDLMTSYFWLLKTDAIERGILRDDFYFLCDRTLQTFKKFQGFGINTVFPGTRIEQAFLIWRQPPQQVMQALMRANGFNPPDQFIHTEGLSALYALDDGTLHQTLQSIKRK